MPRPTRLITLEEWRNRRHKSGTKVRISGQYGDVDGNQRTCVAGEVFPPSVRPGLTWKLTDTSRGDRE